MMRKRRTGVVVFLGVLLLAALGVVGWFVLVREVTFVLTREYLQSQIVAAFPYEKRELLYTLAVRDPKLVLTDKSDRIGLSVNLEVSALGGKKMHGSLIAAAGLRYDPVQTAFFLDNPRVTEVLIDGLPKSISSRIPGVATTALQGVLKGKPVYRLTETDAKSFLLRRTLKAVKINNGNVEATLGVR